jgi:integrase
VAKLRKFKNSPYWFAVGRDSTGKRWTVSTKQTARDAAGRAARRIELERAVPQLQPCPLAKTLVALDDHKQRKRVSTSELEIVRTKAARLLEYFGPAFDCQQLTRAHEDGYVDARRAMGIADSTIAKELGKLHEALRLAKAHGKWAGEFDAIRTDVLAAAEPGERWLDDPEYLALMDHVFPRHRDYVLVHCHTGVRYGELYRIEGEHIDHDGRRLWVVGTKGESQYRQRWVPLSDEAYDVLCARAELHQVGPLFPHRWLKPNMKLSLARACRRAGIAPVTANDLRRTFCSWCARRGVSERECQRFMGHSPASLLVRKVYAQLAPEAGRAAVAAFPRLSQAVSQSEGQIAGLHGGSADHRTPVSPQKPGDPNEIRTRVTGVRARQHAARPKKISGLRGAC